MPNFKPITINEKELFDSYLNINKFPNSEYNFTTIYAWENINRAKFTILNNCLVVYGVYQEMDFCYFPLGEMKDLKDCFIQLNEIFKSRNKPFIMTSLSKPMIQILNELGILEKFSIEPKRDTFDYVYNREILSQLRGKKLHSRKNHYNYFIKNYNYRLEDINLDNDNQIGDKVTELIFDRSVNKEDELTATARVLKYRDQLGLISKVLYVDDEIVGIIMGERHHDTALIQIAKSDIQYRGASVALFKLFLSDYYTDCTYTNFMEDLGIEGLRKAKLSFNPEFFIEKSFLKKEIGIDF